PPRPPSLPQTPPPPPPPPGGGAAPPPPPPRLVCPRARHEQPLRTPHIVVLSTRGRSTSRCAPAGASLSEIGVIVAGDGSCVPCRAALGLGVA
ncbi:hypothetical protein, partial [Nocardia cyriacigeorgica]|uniref:hypothetical protein n=1 Tax=Nocardia cyriacigeorgica TaxID=135487 RepID=UPI002453A0EF